jgi:glycosyl transferase family 92
MFRSFFFIFLFFHSLTYAFQYQLSICAIFQNEAQWMKEWIDYHHSMGVEHFWLYNNNSNDNYQEVLKPYIQQGIVDLIQWTSEDRTGTYYFHHVQAPAYDHAIKNGRNITKWMAVIDLDEFIVPKQENSIIECLEKRYPYFSGVCINWQCFGTSHISKLNPDRKMIEQLVMKMQWNHSWNESYKSIVQPLHVLTCPSPHLCYYLPNHWAVNTKYEKVSNISPVDISVMQINHYWTRDENHLNNVKKARYTKWNGSTGGVDELANLMNEEFDYSILKFIHINEISD